MRTHLRSALVLHARYTSRVNIACYKLSTTRSATSYVRLVRTTCFTLLALPTEPSDACCNRCPPVCAARNPCAVCNSCARLAFRAGASSPACCGRTRTRSVTCSLLNTKPCSLLDTKPCSLLDTKPRFHSAQTTSQYDELTPTPRAAPWQPFTCPDAPVGPRRALYAH
jgi:hypothetical protein